MFDEKLKKVLKIGGVIILGIFLVGLYGLLFPKKNPVVPMDGGGQGMSYPGSFSVGMPEPSVSSMDQSSKSFSERGMATDSIGVPETGGDVDFVQTEKKMIKTGDLDLKVASADKAAEEIATVAKNNGGDVFSRNFYESPDGNKTGFVIVKVPNDKFEKTFSELKKVASHVVSESVSGQDVTEQYADLEIQIRNKKAEEESFLKILESATKIDDVLAVTREAARARREIESLEGRKRFLDSQIDMSSITVNVSEDVSLPVGKGWRPWEVVKNSFKELVSNMQGFVDNIIGFFVVVLPTILVYGLILILVYVVGKKIYSKFFKKV